MAGFGLAAASAFLIITVLHVVVGELAPKSMAISRTRRTSLAVAPWMRAFYLMTKPVVDLFNAMGNLLLKPFGIPPAGEAGHAPHSESELRTLLRQSQDEGLIDPDDRDLTENVFAFGNRRAREVMTPRPEVDFVTVEDDVPGAARVARASGHTRLPLCEPEVGLDGAVGLIHVKDLLEAALDQREVCLADLARPICRVSESMLLGELMRDLRRRRQQLALVVASVRLLTRELGVDISEPHEATVGGHIVELLGRVPEVGETVELDGYEVEVSGDDGAHITQLRFEPRQR